MEEQRFSIGDRVLWADPGILDYNPQDRDWVHNRVFIIYGFADEAPDRMCNLVEEGGYSEAQAWEHELTLLN